MTETFNPHKTSSTMKTKVVILAATLMLMSAFAQADPNQRTLTFKNALGRILVLPMKAEEQSEPLPFDATSEFTRIKKTQACQPLDLSAMTKPEKEDSIPFDTQKVIMEMRKVE